MGSEASGSQESCLEGRNRDTDVLNKHMDTKGGTWPGEGGMKKKKRIVH